MRIKAVLCSYFLIILILASCSSINKESQTDQIDAWEVLFNGESLEQWRNFGHDEIRGWTIINGELTCLGIEDSNGDLITKDTYKDFILELDWKISNKGNSGILYLVQEDTFATSYHTGPEYQIIDDKGYPDLEDWQKSGSNYGIDSVRVPPTNPVGKWNDAIIQVKNGQVSHWLNGRQVVTYTLWTEEWKMEKEKSKWKDFPAYGAFKEGHIALQDHGGLVSFRNIKIKRL